ncbi:MAG: GrpB family protein [Clostridia bacterium]|nr:GrpB family protein [Clostridia bacterium]
MGKKLSEITLEELWQLFPIFLVEPRAEWQQWYAQQKSSLEKLLPDAEINHIGSTAIHGIWAKNIVDILAEISEEADMEAACRTLRENGWRLMSREPGRISFNMGYTENGFAEKVYHLHLRRAGDRDEVYFRDYMNTHPAAAKEYENLKLGLWKKYEHNRDGYTNAKTELVQKYTRMAKINFGFMENSEFADHAPALFDILHTNMSSIIQSETTRAEEYAAWSKAVGEGMQKPARRIILINCGTELIGFFQYYVNAYAFMMEEIQLKREYQTKYGVFRSLFDFLTPQLPADIPHIKAFAHPNNNKSDAILKHMGLSLVSAGEFNAYCGKYSDFLKWHNKSRS